MGQDLERVSWGGARWMLAVVALVFLAVQGGCQCGDEGGLEAVAPSVFEGSVAVLAGEEPALWLRLEPEVLRESGLMDGLLDAVEPLSFPDSELALEEMVLLFPRLSVQSPTLLARGEFPRARLLAVMRGQPGAGGWVHETAGRSSMFTDPGTGRAVATPARNLLIQGSPSRVREVLLRLDDVRDGVGGGGAGWMGLDGQLVARVQVGEGVRRVVTDRVENASVTVLLRMVEAVTLQLLLMDGGDPSLLVRIDTSEENMASVVAGRLQRMLMAEGGPGWMARVSGVGADGAAVVVQASLSREELREASAALARWFEEGEMPEEAMGEGAGVLRGLEEEAEEPVGDEAGRSAEGEAGEEHEAEPAAEVAEEE